MKSEMTHRERIIAAINHQKTDRVPMDFWGVPEITRDLMGHFGVSDWFGFSKALDIDKIINVDAKMKPGKRRDMWDIEWRKIPLNDGKGWYDEPVKHPLGNYETIDEIEANYIWPTTDMFDYSTIKEQCKRARNEGHAIEGGYISLTYFYEIARGTEQMFVDFAADPDLAEYILYKINEFSSAHAKRILDEADGLVDITQVTDDFGSQSGLLMSEAMIERYLGQYYRSNVEMAKSFGAIVFHHDDGAITDIVPWVVSKGCQVLNPIQWHLPGWNLNKLKSDFGDKLCFHGGIDNQLVLPFKGIPEVKAEVETCIDALYSDRTGYILAPCHNIQTITPIENVIAMYEHAKEYTKML